MDCRLMYEASTITLSSVRAYVCYDSSMLNRIKYFWWDVKAIQRLVRPENSVKTFIEIVGAFWLWRTGVRREYKIQLSRTWSCYADFAWPRYKVIIECDGFVHGRPIRKKKDVARDYALMTKGWTVWRVTVEDMRHNPSKVRRDVRRFVNAHH